MRAHGVTTRETPTWAMPTPGRRPPPRWELQRGRWGQQYLLARTRATHRRLSCILQEARAKRIMPETPNCETVARRIVKLARLFDDDDMARMIAEQLRQVWNARGASDAAVLKSAGVSADTISHLDVSDD